MSRSFHPILLGEFIIEKDMIVGDPCYEENESISVKPGVYEAYVQKEERYKRIKRMFAIHKDSKKEQKWGAERVFDAGVDSGQICFVDAIKYRKDEGLPNFRGHYTKGWKKSELKETGEKWYRYCCERTLGERQAGMIQKNGFVSSSGLGDGCYPVIVTKNNDNEIVYVEVTFM